MSFKNIQINILRFKFKIVFTTLSLRYFNVNYLRATRVGQTHFFYDILIKIVPLVMF